MEFSVSNRFRARYPGAIVGCLAVSGVPNLTHSDALERRVDEVELRLRERSAGLDRAGLRALPPFDRYGEFYRQFGQTYHVLQQVESVGLKGKPIPRRSALVEAVFAEELEHGVLSAIHDAAFIGESLWADVATGGESMVTYAGTERSLRVDDMYIRDETGILSSVLDGPAIRARVEPTTERVVVCVYAPAGVGVELVDRHLDAVAANMHRISSQASADSRSIIVA